MLNYTYIEDRVLASVFLDNLPNYGYDRVSYFKISDEVVVKDKLLSGEFLVKGQVVLIKSSNADNEFGKVPAIVRSIRTLTDSVEYRLYPLVGDFSNIANYDTTVNDIVFNSLHTPERIEVYDESLNGVISAIIATGLGSENIVDTLYVKLGVERLFVLDLSDEDNPKFVSVL